jgi:hypothetical protein
MNLLFSNENNHVMHFIVLVNFKNKVDTPI